jgi:CheY-like chemotaxis protein
VLVVEDNKVNLLIARRFLGALGAEVTEAQNGREAVDAYAGDAFDLVLMDCQMPVMDGYDATRAIRADEAIAKRPRVPIIAMTANAFEEDVSRCLEAGMDDHLSKPYTLAQLTERTATWIGTSPRRAEGRSAAA